MYILYYPFAQHVAKGIWHCCCACPCVCMRVYFSHVSKIQKKSVCTLPKYDERTNPFNFEVSSYCLNTKIMDAKKNAILP